MKFLDGWRSAGGGTDTDAVAALRREWPSISEREASSTPASPEPPPHRAAKAAAAPAYIFAGVEIMRDEVPEAGASRVGTGFAIHWGLLAVIS
ncbi:MAG: hypothetical protein IID06_05840 [Gemmatimonadetes bacterium]|nr:hypothetical protein [Gemmatimonadota bacterium]